VQRQIQIVVSPPTSAYAARNSNNDWVVVKGGANSFAKLTASYPDSTVMNHITWNTGQNTLGNTGLGPSLDPNDLAQILVTNNGVRGWPTPTNNTVIITPNFNGLGGGNQLGPTDAYSNSNLNYAYAIGKIEAVAVPSPTGITKIVTNGWNMRRTVQYIFFDDGFFSKQTPTNGVNDPIPNYCQYFDYQHGVFFDLDAPGFSGDLEGTQILDTAESYENFWQYVTVNLGNGDQTCSDLKTWSYESQINVDDGNPVQLNQLSTAPIVPWPTKSIYSNH
jgi:hypothetical protein